jgi:endogenous inhibitor of DNA gyrase (YacG/DUF329 family)
MIHGRCPTCERTFEITSISELPSFPFCSDRCRLIDLGRWMDGSYRISGPPTHGESKTGAVPAEHPEGHDDGVD